MNSDLHNIELTNNTSHLLFIWNEHQVSRDLSLLLSKELDILVCKTQFDGNVDSIYTV